MRSRIASLESANRDTIALLEAKTTTNDSLAQDIQKQHQKGLELSQQITTLQQSVQNATSAASSAKFREQSLKQEVELAKRNSEWFENELKTKNAETAKFRKEKSAKISELQRLNEDVTSNLEALKRTEQILRGRLSEMQKKAEDSLAKVQELQESAAKVEEGYRQELEASRRLAELQAQQTETHRNRLREVEAGVERAKDEAAEEVGRARQELETFRQAQEEAEQRVEELEAEIDRLKVLAEVPQPSSVPGTPRQGMNGSMYGRSGSPANFGTPGSVRSKSAVTATQAFEQLYHVKKQLTEEKRRYEILREQCDELAQMVETQAPEIVDLRTDNARLEQELVDMSQYVDQATTERERARKDAKKAEIHIETATAESNILRQQLRDLSAQVKLLLFEVDARERGLDAMSTAERSQLESLARGDIGEDALEGMTDTDRLISQRLTVFKNISELQEKNQELLKITRHLGAQMESEEVMAAKDQAAKDHAHVQELEIAIAGYKQELESLAIRSESFVKERDMFRRMLQHRGQIPADTDLATAFGKSVSGNENGLDQSARDNANYATLLREHQIHFDNYRNEQAADRLTLKTQTDRLSAEKVSLQAEIAKVSSQLTFANGRFDMLQANYAMLEAENKELQKRSQILAEAAAKQDTRTQQVAEDLVEAKSLVESMRNENSNLKAEKNLWKDIQDRLSQDNENLINERARLNNLVANQQSLQNERELSEAETRRRLQAQVETLESELTLTKRKLADEVEESKKNQQRKDYDSQQHQRRIDDLAASLGKVREELVAAKTSRDHLQSRVDDLTIELRSAEERVEVLQPRPTPRPGTTNAGDTSQEESLSKEQELALEVSELKRDLELARSELEGAKTQMEQYRAISQSSEEELQSLNATQDLYREEMDQIVEGKDAKIRELQQRTDDIASELTNTNNELTALRNQHGETARQIQEEKSILEAEIARLKDDDERHATSAQFHQQDLRAQAAIATKAQQDYENELVKHAEAAKLLQSLRAEHNQLKTESASLKADAESSRIALSQSESSWDERREQFEVELRELKARRDDANAQNKVLHQQLENVSAQIVTLQQTRSAAVASTEAGTPTNDVDANRNADGLRELNSFLRREKEIVEVQYELKVQEAKRLQQQYEYAQSQLDETRLKLEQERQTHANTGQSSVAHHDLMEKLNELNVFRESSVTLRNETRQAQAQVADKSKRVEELMGQIQPLEAQIRELELSKEIADGEMQLLQADRDRWQKRTQDIISKYDRIDPAEMEQLKETIETLRTEKDALVQEQQPLLEKIQAFESEKAGWQASKQKIIEQAKEKNRLNAKDIKDRTTERDTAIQEKEALEQQLLSIQQQLQTVQEQLENAQQQLQTALQEKEAAEQRLLSLGQELETIRAERDQTTAAIPATQVEPPAASAIPSTNSEAEALLLRKERDEAVQAKEVLDARVSSLQEQLRQAYSERDTAIAEANEAKATLEVLQANQANGNGQEEGQVDETTAPTSTLTDAERQSLQQRVAEAESRAKEQEEKARKLEADVESTLKTRSEKMKAALNKKLVESREAQKAEIRVELEADFNLKLEQERKILAAETQAAASALPVSVEAAATEEKPSAPPSTPTASGLIISSGPPDLSTLTDAQVRDFLASNATVKGIVMSNIKKKVEMEIEKLKQEQERLISEKLAEAQVKAEAAKAQAVSLEGKKSALKLSMSDNKAKLATARLDYVKTAASDTPQKPVVEVWEVASVLKMPAAPVAPPVPVAPTGK